MLQVQQQVKGCMEDWSQERPVSSDQIGWDVFTHYSGYYIKFLVKQSLLMFLRVVLYGVCLIASPVKDCCSVWDTWWRCAHCKHQNSIKIQI